MMGSLSKVYIPDQGQNYGPDSNLEIQSGNTTPKANNFVIA
jgi:hypothetical protein